ncbi:RAI1-domain-containing protein [Eremomyces bilateralis CBS 781.70]|uniref:Decapping nuclease n=1 Tax=Eremomyces bilateralis CBS 781.70 TaxID=1392243 RepID=A0A6G1G5R6_9PEZI|nr:RAI1-domain-containing protein [Eremomyces bilateralis CBS 781.70]KAF1813368.1 RAI1-domain-containing protein [Eremomyces bilateralis CBS 781.70]
MASPKQSQESVATFGIRPVERFSGGSSAIKRPREFTHFSYDSEHVFHPDVSSLKYYYPPSLPSDLCAGFSTFQKHDDSTDEHITSLLRSVMLHEQSTRTRTNCDILTWRGMLTKILTTPFDRFSEFEMNATCFQGTIFIEENHAYKVGQRIQQDREARQRGGVSSERQDMMSFWGYKFETLSTIPDVWDKVSRDAIEGRESDIVENKSQYCSVVSTGIGGAKLVLGGEVDAVWDRKPDPRPEDGQEGIQGTRWVELKTAEQPSSDKDMVKFERKLLKFWAQSFLLGVPKIIVGFRNKDGMLVSLEELETQSIPGNVRRVGKRTWDGNICINFTAAFLEFLKSTIRGEGVWRICRRPQSPSIEVFKVENKGHGEILTSEFINWRTKIAADELAAALSGKG